MNQLILVKDGEPKMVELPEDTFGSDAADMKLTILKALNQLLWAFTLDVKNVPEVTS